MDRNKDGIVYSLSGCGGCGVVVVAVAVAGAVRLFVLTNLQKRAFWGKQRTSGGEINSKANMEGSASKRRAALWAIVVAAFGLFSETGHWGAAIVGAWSSDYSTYSI